MAQEKYGRSKKYNRVYGEAMKTPIGRFSWPYLTEPKVGELNGKTISNYEVQLIIDKGDPELKDFQLHLQAMANEMLDIYNKYAPAKLAGVDVFKDGDQADLEKYPFYKNAYLILARNPEPVKILNSAKKEISADAISAGMKGRLVVLPHLGPTGVSYRMERVQLLEDDGVRFGGVRRDYDSFLDAVEGEAGEPDSAPEAPEAPGADPAEMRKQIASAVKGGKGKQAALDLL